MTSTVKYFVGKTKKANGEARYHVFRQRISGRLIKKTVVEVFHKDGWKSVKKKFARMSKLFESRQAARREKYALQGRP